VPHAPPTSLYLIWCAWWYLVMSTNYEASQCANFSRYFMPLRPSLIFRQEKIKLCFVYLIIFTFYIADGKTEHSEQTDSKHYPNVINFELFVKVGQFQIVTVACIMFSLPHFQRIC
jgi:hypothetical protein